MTSEELVQKFGEQYRRLIEDYCAFLDKQEPAWMLDKPIDREESVRSLLERVHVR